jgi:hypothetical protein
MAMAPDDEQARKKRAEELRSSMKKLGKKGKPSGARTPREMTDEAARKARDDARSGPASSENRKDK